MTSKKHRKHEAIATMRDELQIAVENLPTGEIETFVDILAMRAARRMTTAEIEGWTLRLREHNKRIAQTKGA